LRPFQDAQIPFDFGEFSVITGQLFGCLVGFSPLAPASINASRNAAGCNAIRTSWCASEKKAARRRDMG
jgi:hypothetical protein